MKKILNALYIIIITVMVGNFMIRAYSKGHFEQILQIGPMSNSVKEALIVPAISFIFLILPMLLLFFIIPARFKKEAEAKYSNMRRILGDGRWKSLTNSPQKYYNSVCFVGTYRGRKIKCAYKKWRDSGIKKLDTGRQGVFEVSSKPRVVPKKLPWYKFQQSAVNVYGRCFLNGDRVTFSTIEANLSTERCNEILEDLNRACEMIERGEYNLT